MKKFALLLCSAICMCVVYAQHPVGNIQKIKTPFKAVKVYKQNPNASNEVRERVGGAERMHQVKVANHKSPLTYVDDPPEGELKRYKRSGWMYIEEWDGIYRSTQSGIGKVVFAENNEVYLQNIISRINSGKWVKGTLSEDKKTITIAPGEIVEDISVEMYDEVEDVFREYYGELKLTMLKVERGDDIMTFTEDPTTPITYTIDGDSIMLNNTMLNKEVLGVVYSSFTGGAEKINGMWVGCADCETKYKLFTEQPIDVPEDVSLECYSLISKDVHLKPQTYDTSFLLMGMKDNDVYMTSFNTLLPNAVIKGTINGNTIEFPSKQFIGDAYGYLCYLMTTSYELFPQGEGGVEQKHTFTDKFVFNYDASTRKLTPATAQTAMLVNANDVFPYAFFTFNEPVIKYYVETPATPVSPDVVDVEDYYDTDGVWHVLMRVNTISTDGDVLDKEKLYYRMYLNDNLYTFTNEKYEFGEDMTLFPYYFYDAENEYIVPTELGVNVYLLEQTINNVGVQAVYKGGNEEHASNISWWEVTDIKGIKDNMNTHLTNQKYNLQGMPVNDDYKGVVIMNNKKYMRGGR